MTSDTIQPATPAVAPIAWPARIATAAGSFAVIGGTVTLIGWAAGIRRLTDWKDDGISMFANTAICAAASGAALLLMNLASKWRTVVCALGALTALIGGLTLFQHISGISLGIDTLLFNRPWGMTAAAAPMRMGPPASTSFLVIGVSLLLLNLAPRMRGVGAALGVFVAAISMLSIIGFLYGAQQMYTMPRLTGIALQTAMMVLALGIGLIASAPERQPMRTLLDPGAAGLLARRALPFVIALPLLLGWLRVMVHEHGLLSPAFATAVRTLIELALLTGMLWWASAMVRTREQALRRSEADVRRQSDQLAAHAQEMAEASRRKDEFLATLAHELRNPLAPLRNGLEVLRLQEDDPQAREQTRGMMHRQLTHLVRLVDDLLDASRITRDQLQLRRERVELASIIQEAVQSCRPQLESVGLRLDVTLPGETIAIDADPVRLAQVFGNIMGNAIKYTEAGGWVAVKAHREGSDVVISVRDSGIGIPPAMLDSVFEMFAQVDRSLERTRGGLGIGLTLARRLVEMHGGSVSAHSEGDGRGSEFVVRLPLPVENFASAKAPPAPRPTAARITSRRVLVVDDNRDSARSLSRLLELSGWSTQLAYDGVEAVEQAAAHSPDVVLLDIGLPKMNGYDACREMRALLAGRQVAIIALTGWGQESDRDRSREAGFDAHVVKPVDFSALTSLLDALSARTDSVQVPPAHSR